MFYLITIALSAVVIATGNFLYDGDFTFLAFGKLLLVTVLGVAAVFVIDGVVAFIVRRMPEKWFAPEAKLFLVSEKERAFYRKSGINKWKDFVPELGCFTGFHKDRVRDPSSSTYLGRFLLESNYGVLGHVSGAALGFLIMLLPFLRPLSMALPIAVINMILSMLPTFVLRFNTPSLRHLYRRSLRKEAKANQMQENPS